MTEWLPLGLTRKAWQTGNISALRFLPKSLVVRLLSQGDKELASDVIRFKFREPGGTEGFIFPFVFSFFLPNHLSKLLIGLPSRLLGAFLGLFRCLGGQELNQIAETQQQMVSMGSQEGCTGAKARPGPKRLTTSIYGEKNVPQNWHY